VRATNYATYDDPKFPGDMGMERRFILCPFIRNSFNIMVLTGREAAPFVKEA
jgi:hypothetical protein